MQKKDEKERKKESKRNKKGESNESFLCGHQYPQRLKPRENSLRDSKLDICFIEVICTKRELLKVRLCVCVCVRVKGGRVREIEERSKSSAEGDTF